MAIKKRENGCTKQNRFKHRPPETLRERYGERKLKRVAIAFQGGGLLGGSYATGVVRALVECKPFKKKGKGGKAMNAFDAYTIDVFSGTSSGALVASVCWSCVFRDLLAQLEGNKFKDEDGYKPPEIGTSLISEAPEILFDRWHSVAYGLVPNAAAARVLRTVDHVAAYHPLYKAFACKVRAPYLRNEFTKWIEGSIDFGRLRGRLDGLLHEEEIRQLIPGLALGVVDYDEGIITTLYEEDFEKEAVIASGSLDDVIGLTSFDPKSGRAGEFVDGGYGQNPPINELPHYGIDEVWVFRAYPKVRPVIGDSPHEQRDRKKELLQNALVEHELDCIRVINDLLEEPEDGGDENSDCCDRRKRGKLCSDYYRPITIEDIDAAHDEPACSSIVNSKKFVNRVMAQGYLAAKKFLEQKAKQSP